MTILPAGLVRGYAANEERGVALEGLSGRGSWFVETVPRIDEQGQKQATPLGDPAELLKAVKPKDWSDYTVIRGARA